MNTTVTLADAKALMANGEFPKVLNIGGEVVRVVDYDLKTNVVTVRQFFWLDRLSGWLDGTARLVYWKVFEFIDDILEKRNL